ncbi:sensor histidine kinase, partial [Euzebya sp.]|uniref:sensor histidine kinase n=1 Tax=Euzebya sp. TaxID=1971409 RepID=UPI0035179824
MAELTRAQRVLSVIRLAAIPFAALQVLTYYLPYVDGQQRIAWAAVGLLAVGTPIVWVGASRVTTRAAATRWAVAGLAMDTTALLTLVVAYTFDPNTAVWAILFLIPIEGAFLFNSVGAMGSLAAVVVGYTLREVYGAVALDVPFLWQSVSFRMGLATILAVAVGVLSSGLVRERDRLRETTQVLEGRTADLSEANAALRSARRAQAEFVAVTNHELRTPLTAIRGFARTLQVRWDDMDEASRRAAVDAIDAQSKRLGELVEDVLTVSSMRAGGVAVAPRPLQLRCWLTEATEVAGVEAEVDCPGDLMVQADATRLLQILVHLLSNAAKYGAAPIVVAGEPRGDRVVVSVRDHGPGVPPDFQGRMFEEFTQASEGESRTADGYGLGLAIVRYLARALGGDVTYRTAPGRGGAGGGAVFEVDLPAVASGDVSGARAAAPPPPSTPTCAPP